jgi:hypothetical protein
MREFIDRPHQISPEFDEFFDTIGEKEIDDAGRDKLRAFINQDPDCFGPYLLLASYYLDQDDEDACKDIIEAGYDRAMKRILDDTGRWPDRMEISHDENMHIQAMLSARGQWLWANNQTGAALDLFRNLLRVDPHGDLEPGLYILAIRIGYTFDAFGEEFGEDPGLSDDAAEWFAEHSIDFPDEFWDELFEEVTEMESNGDDNGSEEKDASRTLASKRKLPAGVDLPSTSGQPHETKIMQLKITLKGTKPPVWRRILIPDTATFEDLHDAIQTYFGWDNDHLHDFTMALSPKGKRKITIAGKMPDGSQPGDVPDGLIEDRVHLRDFISTDTPKITYTYDFGAMNEHAIELEILLPPEAGKKYPSCIKKKGEIPMEGEDLDDDDEDDEDK